MQNLDMDLLDPVECFRPFTRISLSTIPASSPPVFPVSPTTFMPFPLAASAALMMFMELPLVLIASKYISFLPTAFNIPGENFIKTIIVGSTGDVGRI